MAKPVDLRKPKEIRQFERGKVDINETGLGDIIHIQLKTGLVILRLRPDWAVNTCRQIRKLTVDKFYDGLKWHRVIPNFMAQTGCPLGEGTGNAGYFIAAEFNDTKHRRGIVSMARQPNHPDTASSQFFVVLADSPHLNGQYTAFGEIVAGLDHIDRIKKGDNAVNNGKVDDPDTIISMRMAADAPIKITLG